MFIVVCLGTMSTIAIHVQLYYQVGGVFFSMFQRELG